MNYVTLHDQILWDLETFFTERIKYYKFLDKLADAYRAELEKVQMELGSRDLPYMGEGK